MITPTYFGEITELDSRAVWYSDEEDEDEDDDDIVFKTSPNIKQIEPLSYERCRSDVGVEFTRSSSLESLEFENCIIGLCSGSQFKNMKSINLDTGFLYGYFDSCGKVFAFPTNTNPGKYLLWLLFDASNPLIVGHEVAFFVEKLLRILHDEFKLDHTSQVMILSQQFTVSENLEYLSNFKSTSTLKIPFIGRPILPPSLIKNQFESSLFEQLTLTLEPALVVCLPDPKKFWFDKTKNWPSIPNLIVEYKLNDDNLEKTLIFT